MKAHLSWCLEAKTNVSREALFFLLSAPAKQYRLSVLKDRSLLLVRSFRLRNNHTLIVNVHQVQYHLPSAAHGAAELTEELDTYLLRHLFLKRNRHVLL